MVDDFLILGPSPDVDFVLSLCLQSNLLSGHIGKLGPQPTQLQAGTAPSMSDLSGSSKSHLIPSVSSFKLTRDRQTGKRKDQDSMLPSFPSLVINCTLYMHLCN